MLYYLVAGEKSGDLHAGNLMKALKEQDPNAEFRFWGGDQMQAVGGNMVRHYREFGIMGIGEIVKKIPSLLKAIKQCANDIIATQPDAVIFVDFAAFNLRVAPKVKKSGIRTFYYISPKVWAWNQSRAKTIKRLIDRMFVIMTFEESFYQKYDYQVDYVGNPIFDAIQTFVPQSGFLDSHGLEENQPILALLPGSRHQEVARILPPMVEAAKLFRKEFPNTQVAVAGVDNLDASLYEPAIQASFPILQNQTYDLLSHARLALVTSGTATLETALFKVPQVVAYKTSKLTYLMGRLVLKIPYISLVNLVAEKLLAEELIQHNCTGKHLHQALIRLNSRYTEAKIACEELYATVRTEGASVKTAKLMVEDLQTGLTQKRRFQGL